VSAVYGRARTLVQQSQSDRKALLIAALIHELDDPVRRRLAGRLGSCRDAKAACAAIASFGALWSLQDGASVRDLVLRLGSHLRLYLLFELAHEGKRPPFFDDLWGEGGLGRPPFLRRY
jgi:hypothetical protein